MKKKVLLIDESLTVQKVVALTLDRQRHTVTYAKSRAEAIKMIGETSPDLILVSDQVADITIATFPKEVEAWVGRGGAPVPPLVLITGQDIKEARHYAAVLKKPFSPAALTGVVGKFQAKPSVGATAKPPTAAASDEDFEDQRLQKIFNDTFNDEANLVRETFQEEYDNADNTNPGFDMNSAEGQPAEEAQSWAPPPPPIAAGAPAPPSPNQLWSTPAPGMRASPGQIPAPPPVQNSPRGGARIQTTPPPPPAPSATPVMSTEESVAYKDALQSRVADRLDSRDLDQIVDKLLAKLVPPIVERLVNERLDQLLKEQESFLEVNRE